MTSKKKILLLGSLASLATTDCLQNFANETVAVKEWDDQKVICRAMSAGDWIDYQNLAKTLIKELPPEELANIDEKDHVTLISPIELHAFVFVRCVYAAENQQRILKDEDRPAVVGCFSPVHDRLVAKVYDLSRMAAGDDTKNG